MSITLCILLLHLITSMAHLLLEYDLEQKENKKLFHFRSLCDRHKWFGYVWGFFPFT